MSETEFFTTDHEYSFSHELRDHRKRQYITMLSGEVEHVTAPRPSWRDCPANRVRVAIERMLPESHVFVEGVCVESVTHGRKIVYRVGCHKYALAEAVAAVIAAASGRAGGEA